MRLEKLNGWQRLWVLTSLIYLVAVIFVAVIDFPTPWKSYIPDDEIIKKLSNKTLQIIAKTNNLKEDHIPTKGDIFDRVAAEQSQPITIEFPNGNKLLVPYDTKQSELDYINKDYCNTVIDLTNKKRIYFIGTMLLVWVIPCLVVYALGMSFHWVYRGFKQKS